MSIIPDHTICAISTPPGVGGIAVVRISGPQALEVVAKIWRGKGPASVDSHTAHLGTVLDSRGEQLDQGVMTVFRAPASFTGEDVVELAVHGSRYVQRELINSLIHAGASLAQPGEFTRRAFANGRLDLAEAEGVADVIASTSRAAHRLAINQMRGQFSKRLAALRQQLLELASLLELELDFSEEDVEFASRRHLLQIAHDINAEVTRLHASFATGSAIKDGIPVAIAGATNVGKSSLLNALVGDDRAIVSDIHGTTRDLIEDTITIGDYLFRFIDTAGLRATTDIVEEMGINRSRQAIGRARIVILVLDATTHTIPAEIIDAIKSAPPHTYIIAAVNKTDLAPSADTRQAITTAIDSQTNHRSITIIDISAVTGEGLDDLRRALHEAVAIDDNNADDIIVTNARHVEALDRAATATARIIDGLHQNLSGDFIAQDVRETIHHLAEITGGEITTPDILATIFSRFCIGK